MWTGQDWDWWHTKSVSQPRWRKTLNYKCFIVFFHVLMEWTQNKKWLFFDQNCDQTQHPTFSQAYCKSQVKSWQSMVFQWFGLGKFNESSHTCFKSTKLPFTSLSLLIAPPRITVSCCFVLPLIGQHCDHMKMWSLTICAVFIAFCRLSEHETQKINYCFVLNLKYKYLIVIFKWNQNVFLFK